jgi:hypothetical protein
MSNRDNYKRIEISPRKYQCGCRWTREKGYGDVLRQCLIHQQHTNMLVEKFDRENK